MTCDEGFVLFARRISGAQSSFFQMGSTRIRWLWSSHRGFWASVYFISSEAQKGKERDREREGKRDRGIGG